MPKSPIGKRSFFDFVFDLEVCGFDFEQEGRQTGLPESPEEEDLLCVGLNWFNGTLVWVFLFNP